MSFLTPIAGLIAGSIGSGLVLLFWMLKLRRKPIKVSSTLLWKRSVRDLEGNIPWQRVRPSFLLFLQLLAVILLALAIARPVRDASIRFGGQVAVVIDAGASMGAISDDRGRTRLDLAKRDAADLVRSIGSRSSTARFRVIRAGTVPQMLTSASGTWRQALAAIDSIEGSQAPSDLGAAIVLAGEAGDQEISEEASSDRSLQSFVFTDAPEGIAMNTGSVRVVRPASEQPPSEARGNLGIVLVGGQRDQSDPVACRVFVTIAGEVGGAVGVRVHAREGERVLAARALELTPDQQGIVESATTLTFDLDHSAIIELSIEREDELGSDNHAWIWMPDPSPIVTTIIAPDGVADPLLVDGFHAATGGDVVVVGQDESIAPGTDLVVFDRTEAVRSVGFPTIRIGTNTNRDTDRDDATPKRVLSWDRAHPVMLDVDLGALVYTSSVIPDGIAIATGREGAVITESSHGGVRDLSIAFAIEDSNWGVQVSMPMFLYNAVRYLLPGTSGTGIVHHTGQPIIIDGDSFPAVDQTGMTMVNDQPVGVSLLDRDQTLRAAAVMESGPDASDRGLASLGRGFEGRIEIWRWFVLAALMVLMLEWTLDLLRRRM